MPKKSERTKRLESHMVAGRTTVTIEPERYRKPRKGEPPFPTHASGEWLALGHPDLAESFSLAMIHVDVIEGRLVCNGVHLETATELTGAALRAFPVAAIAPMAMAMAQLMNSDLRDVKPSTAKPMGRKGYDEAHFVDVANMYREALIAAPGRPIAWMTERYENREDPPSEDTVRRWVRHVRTKLPHLLEGGEA